MSSVHEFTFYSCLQFEVCWFLIENKFFIQFIMCMVFPPSTLSRSSHFLTAQILTHSYSFSRQRTIRNFKNNCREKSSWEINSLQATIKFTLFYPFTGRPGDSVIVICTSIVSLLEINSFWLVIMTCLLLSQSWDPFGQTHADLVHAATFGISSCVCWSWHVKNVLFSYCPSSSLASMIFRIPILKSSLNPEEKDLVEKSHLW